MVLFGVVYGVVVVPGVLQVGHVLETQRLLRDPFYLDVVGVHVGVDLVDVVQDCVQDVFDLVRLGYDLRVALELLLIRITEHEIHRLVRLRALRRLEYLSQPRLVEVLLQQTDVLLRRDAHHRILQDKILGRL